MNMAALTKLYLVALVFVLFSNYSARCISASALDHQDEHKSRWFLDCETGHTKLDRLNCRNAFRLRNKEKGPWSESLKKALPPPPAPVMRGPLPSGDDAPPPPST